MASKETYTDIIEYNCSQAHTGDIKYAQNMPKLPCFIVYDSAFRKAIGDSPKIKLVEQRADKFAHEAGVYIKSTNKNYFTSNYQSGKTIETYAVDCDTHEITEDKYPDVVTANGACHWKDQVLYCCQGDFTTPSALVLVDPSKSTSQIIVNNYYGREFNSINDVVIHHDRDEIWFTDPTYGFEQAFRPSPVLPSQVYRFKPSTGQIWCVADGFVQCNGLCFSPDYKKMYITDTGALLAHGTPAYGQQITVNPRLPASIYEYDVIENGTRLANRQMFAFTDSGIPDGIKCDKEGNVYSGCGDGVHVWDPHGTLIDEWTRSSTRNTMLENKAKEIYAERQLNGGKRQVTKLKSKDDLALEYLIPKPMGMQLEREEVLTDYAPSHYDKRRNLFKQRLIEEGCANDLAGYDCESDEELDRQRKLNDKSKQKMISLSSRAS